MKQFFSFFLMALILIGLQTMEYSALFPWTSIGFVQAQVDDAKKKVSEPKTAKSIETSKETVKPTTPTAPSFFKGDIYNDKTGKYSIINVRDVLLPSVAKWMGSTIGAIAVLFIIWAGIQFLTAEGDPEKISKATKTAFYVVGGLILMMFAYAIVYLFLTIFTPSSSTTPTTPTTPTPSTTPTTSTIPTSSTTPTPS